MSRPILNRLGTWQAPIAGPSRVRCIPSHDAQARAASSQTPNYPGHVPLNFAQSALLAVGSAVGGVVTSRGGMHVSDKKESSADS
jgi:hypothetical protein